jgi:signal transduction histidine kinase
MERERSRIARDIHDELGAKLTKISFLGERLKSRFSNAPGLGPQIDTIAGTARSMIKSLDEIVWAVNPRNDTLEHLVSYLGQYAIQYFQNTAVDCAVTMPDSLPHIWISAERRHHMFLAVKETLNNVLKHSQATKVWVTMNLAEDVFEIVAEDNGQGFGQSANGIIHPETAAGGNGLPGGNGLVNLQTRLREIEGQCIITSGAGLGTRVRLQINLNNHRVN